MFGVPESWGLRSNLLISEVDMTNIARGTARKVANRGPTDKIESSQNTWSQQTSPDAENTAEIARYIAQLTAEMCRMAGLAKLDTLAYFLSMARLEAEMAARQETAPDS